MDVEAPPTPSENTNRLIALCLDAASGRTDGEALRLALNECALDLAEAREAFFTQVQEEEGLLEALPDAIEAVLDGFDAYGAVLTEARSWFAQRLASILDQAAQGLVDAYTSLHHALLSYEWAYLGHGSEPHPALNLMQKVLAAVRQGLMEDDRLDEIFDRLWDHFSKGVEVFEEDPDPIRAGRGAQACRVALAGLQDMDEYLDSREFSALERGYVRLREGCLMLIQQVQDGVGEALISGPTASPQVNWVIHAAQAVLEGVHADLLRQAQEWFEPQLAESYFRFEQCATGALEGPVRMAEQVPVAREGFDRLNRSLPLLRLGANRTDLLPRAIEQLEKGAELLEGAYAVFMEFEEAEGQTLCPRCGASTEAVRKVCGTCGATLLQAVPETVAAAEPAAAAPSHVQRLLLACEEAEAGQMTPQQFGEILAWARQLLGSAELGLRRLPGEDELDPMVTDALHELRAGMAEFRAALDELQGFVHDGRPVHLSAGTRLLVAACDRLASVQGRG